uniref:Uncharacterized protein n=1 Tax=Chromera velia CCMP2878 TaxID=1169474 RepID=A0A0G4FUE6_9ALVE|eukprot:Cvel_18688.t1-p1 / transcript=Cvel_18688.t1 / gene=Cvel_18688 / organism=Chromera_velia_CCMP2878 / gene_product=hypothetical protein / transcript_product=hypothetical protein / location=Cvel_scaffold1564:18514-19587(-) / protein_length=358 / sequence_SO=supercontig / SO=protein_coding / is_pseudo=false
MQAGTRRASGKGFLWAWSRAVVATVMVTALAGALWYVLLVHKPFGTVPSVRHHLGELREALTQSFDANRALVLLERLSTEVVIVEHENNPESTEIAYEMLQLAIAVAPGSLKGRDSAWYRHGDVFEASDTQTALRFASVFLVVISGGLYYGPVNSIIGSQGVGNRLSGDELNKWARVGLHLVNMLATAVAFVTSTNNDLNGWVELPERYLFRPLSISGRLNERTAVDATVTPRMWAENGMDMAELGYERIEKELGESRIDRLDRQGFFKQKTGRSYAECRAGMLYNWLSMLIDSENHRLQNDECDGDVTEREREQKLLELAKRARGWADKTNNAQMKHWCREMESHFSKSVQELDSIA